jgi:predicted  nucleic acid-binding Zn-ribbon protein
MIELFAQKSETFSLPKDAGLTRIPVEEDVVSLSAILLEEGYYEALQGAKIDMDGVTIIDEKLLIPFKARAFLDLSERKEQGDKIDSRSIKKHRNDVFRLAQLLPRDSMIEMPASIQEDMRHFLDLAEADETLKPKDFGVQMTREEGVALLRSVYLVSSKTSGGKKAD